MVRLTDVERNLTLGTITARSSLVVRGFNWQRSTFNWQRSTVNWQRITFNWQRSTFNWQRSTFNWQRSTFFTSCKGILTSTVVPLSNRLI